MLQKNKTSAPSHLNLYAGIEEALSLCLLEEIPAKTGLERLIKNNKWGKRDRDFVIGSFYTGVRWKRWIEYQMGELLDKNNLRLFTQTLIYFTYETLPEITYFKYFNPILHKEKPSLAEKISYPDWMLNAAEENNNLKELEAMNSLSKLVIRANTLKASKEHLIARLEEEGIATSKTELIDDAILFENSPSLVHNPLYKEGFFEVQDYHSQQIAKLIKPKAKQLIVDACAGAGGKSLHLASVSNNQARIIALDTRKAAISELKKRKFRAGATCIKTGINGLYARKELENRASVVLVDAPCSGSGTLRRQPELKWHLDENKIENYAKRQKKILTENAIMVRIGGLLMYVTCSIFRKENEEVTQWFLDKNKDFTLTFEKNLLPSVGYDGFYIAKMMREKVD